VMLQTDVKAKHQMSSLKKTFPIEKGFIQFQGKEQCKRRSNTRK
jgi:hypothetical protein